MFVCFFYLLQVGKWSASGGLNITEMPKRKGVNITDSLANRSLVITTVLVRLLLFKSAKNQTRFYCPVNLTYLNVLM